MSDHLDLERGLQISTRVRQATMQRNHHCVARYQAAGAELIHRHKRLLNFVFGTIMLGMTVAGLWLQVAEKHQRVLSVSGGE